MEVDRGSGVPGPAPVVAREVQPAAAAVGPEEVAAEALARGDLGGG